MCKSISFVLFFVFGVSCAQAQIPEKPDPQLLVHAKTQLKQAEENLDAALAKIEYTDPGDLGQDRAHLVSQIAWEKTCRREQFREQLRDALAVDSEKRNEHQAAVVRAYYLCNIHLESKKPLWLLYQRVGWLRLFVAASEDSSYRQVHANANQREYLRRRILEPYELYTSDPKSVRKQAVAFLAQVVEDYVTRNHPQKKTLEAGEACLANGSKDPVVGLMVMQLVYEHKGGQAERYWKELPPILKELEKPEYPRFLNVLAQRTRFFLLVKRKKNKVSQETLKRGAGWIAKSMIAMLKEEAPVPEHVDSMQLLIKKCAECYSTLKHPMLTQQKQIAKQVEESDVVDWAKSFYLESAYISIGTDKSDDESDDKSDDEKPDVDYLKAAEEWGAKATEELPLAMLPPSNLMWIAYLRGDRDKLREYFEAGIAKRLDNFNVYKAYMIYLSYHHGRGRRDLEAPREFVIEIAKSDNWDMRVPFKAFDLADHLLTYDEGVLKDPEVFIALESVLAECQKRSYPGLKLPIKEWKQQLVLHALFAERYEEAYKYGKELKGDLGIARSYRGRVVTLSRLELLKDSKLHEVEAKIDDGTLDLENVDQLIDELSLSRMDLDTDSSKYLDELVELIRMVQAYESGEWADLMTKSKNLLPWRNPEHRGLNPKKVKLWWVTKQGFRCNSRGQKLQWRWPTSSPYILEADITNKKNKNVKKQSWCRDGLWVSQLPTWHAKSLTKFIFVDTNIGRAGMRDLDRDVVTIKSRVNRDGPNRMRLRVWEDYFDFTIDGVLVGYGAAPINLNSRAVLGKESPNSETTFSNVRIRKMKLPSPLGDERHSDRYWSRRLGVEPQSADLWIKRAEIRMKDLATHEAGIEDLRKAVELAPTNPYPYYKLAIALDQLGRDKETLATLQDLEKRFPHSQERYLLAAFLLSNKNEELRDGKRALGIAKKLVKQKWSPAWKHKRLLAAAHAELGDFENAIKTQKQIIKDGKFSLSLASLEEDLASYESKQPLRRKLAFFDDGFEDVRDNPQPRDEVTVSRGLVAHWSFDKDLTEVGKDAPAEIYGDARIIEGKVRGALALGQPKEGNRFVIRNPAEVINRRTEHSIAFWILPQHSYQGVILGTGSDDGRYRIKISSAYSKLLVRLAGAGVDEALAQTHKKVFTNDKWTHIAITFNGSEEKPDFQLFVDGKKMSRSNFAYGPHRGLAEPQLEIGAALGRVGVGGALDELRVYDRKLSHDEVKSIMSYGQ